MAETSTTPPRNSTARTILIVAILGILGLLGYQYYQGNPGSFLARPAEYQLQYRPADFQVRIDPEEALRVLQNPVRYRREFNQLVYDINTDILNHVSNRMGLTDSLRREALEEYDLQHEEFANLYYRDFMRMRDTSAAVYEAWYEEGGGKLTQIFEEIASNYTCFMVNKVLAAVVRMRNGNIIARGREVDNPCKVATGEALRPMMERMAERAAIDDFTRSKGIFQEKVENVIGELATIEVRDKKGINKKLNTSVAGFNVSETDVEITAISILKAGFRLTDFFEVTLDEPSKTVRITLPEPTILSHEVLPKIEKLDIGWLRELEGVNINESVNSLREAFRAEAMETNVLDRAKGQAENLMETMFLPLVRQMGPDYRIEVDYRLPPARDTQGRLG